MQEATQTARPSRRTRRVAKGGLLACFVAAIIVCASLLLQQSNAGTYTMETVRGMYEQPRNSVEVAIFGTSAPLSGISPWEIEEELGLRAYNCSTSEQPMFASYHLLKDLVKRQRSSLKAVVLDPSIVIDSSELTTQASWAQRIVLNMPLSPDRLATAWELSKSYGTPLAEELFPVFKYHSRWNALTSADYSPEAVASGSAFSRGQYLRYACNRDAGSIEATSAANQGITDELEATAVELRSVREPRSMEYLDKFMALCADSGIDVLFVKIPRKDWSNADHDALSLLAQDYGVDFLDFAMPANFQACDLSYALDFTDAKHPNVRGAAKITRHLCASLAQMPRVKGAQPADHASAEPAYLDDPDWQRYNSCVEAANLRLETDLASYLGQLSNKRLTTFISAGAQVDSANAPAQVLESLRALELLNLAEITKGQKYVAVVSEGKSQLGKVSSTDEDRARLTAQYKNGKVTTVKASMQPGAQLDSRIVLVSGDPAEEDYSVIKYYATEGDPANLSPNGPGLNLVVFETASAELVDTACFDLTTAQRL